MKVENMDEGMTSSIRMTMGKTRPETDRSTDWEAIILNTCGCLVPTLPLLLHSLGYSSWILVIVKKVFLKAPSRIFSFKAALPNTPLPPRPVLARWGTWLHAVLYYADYLGDIQKVVQTFDEEQAVAITEDNAAISRSSVSADLAYIKRNFGNLPGAIIALEARDLPLGKAVKIMQAIEENLNQASGSVGTAIVDKFNRVLQLNPGSGQLDDACGRKRSYSFPAVVTGHLSSMVCHRIGHQAYRTSRRSGM
uniref:(California timema) hypothetical protein n=1 Tax=Timema californicum TaxID=61474 RepID=A0A7R9PBF0_TIMCA|nr:unnamed protein product [Timema californicum]